MKRVSKALCLAVSGALAGSLLMAPQAGAEASIPGEVDFGFTFDTGSAAGIAAVELGTYILLATDEPNDSGLILVDRQGNRAPDSVFSHDPGVRPTGRLAVESMHVMPDGSVMLLGLNPAYGTGGDDQVKQPISRVSNSGQALPSQILDSRGELATFSNVSDIAMGTRESDGAFVLYVSQQGPGRSGISIDREVIDNIQKKILRKFVYEGNGTFREDPGFCPWFLREAGCEPTNAWTQYDVEIMSLLPMPDGGVVVGGGAATRVEEGKLPIRPECGYASNGGLLRLDSNGTIARDWNTCPGSTSGVRRNRAMNSGGFVSELALGRSSSGAEIIFASGVFSSYDGNGVNGVMAVRANNGGINASFDTSDLELDPRDLDLPPQPTALVTSPSYAGGVVVLGASAREGGGGPWASGVFRLDARGTLDRSFMGEISAAGDAPGLERVLRSPRPYFARATLLRDGDLVVVGSYGRATSGAPLQTHESQGAFILKSPMQFGSALTSGGEPRASEIEALPAELVGGGDLRPGVSRAFEVSYSGDLDSYPALPQAITSRTVEVNLVDELDAPCASDAPQSVSGAERTVRIQVQVPREGLQPYLCVKQTISTNYPESSTSSTAYFGRAGVVVPAVQFGYIARFGYPREKDVTWSQATRAVFNETYDGAAAYPLVNLNQREAVRATSPVNLGTNRVTNRWFVFRRVASPQCETEPAIASYQSNLRAGNVPVTAPSVTVWLDYGDLWGRNQRIEVVQGWVCARQTVIVESADGSDSSMVRSPWAAAYVSGTGVDPRLGTRTFARLEEPRPTGSGRTLQRITSVAPGSSFMMNGDVETAFLTPTPVTRKMIVGISDRNGGKCVENPGLTPGTVNPSEMPPKYDRASRWVKVPDNGQGYVCATQTVKNPLYGEESKTVYIPIRKKGYDEQVPDPNKGGKPGLSGGEKDQGKKKN